MNVLLLTPPFTQVNTPYPATSFLKRFLSGRGLTIKQADLGIELFLSIFSCEGLKLVFTEAEHLKTSLSKKSKRTFYTADHYVSTISTVIRFLQSKESSLAFAICRKGYLPMGERLKQSPDFTWLFGEQGVIDKACYLATLYLEELSDFIRTELIPDFGFSRYAEKLAVAATDFAPIKQRVMQQPTFLDNLLNKLLLEHLQQHKPDLVGITIPFPGCLYGALQCSRMIKAFDREIKIVIGGGYVSTELREISDVDFFEFTDFLVMDQGELPLLKIIDYLSGNAEDTDLQRTLTLNHNQIVYSDFGSPEAPFAETGYPDYSDLPLDHYLSLIEIPNPMHRLWNDGNWIKMIAAKGCYWQKCAFCDVSLPYIKNYETIQAKTIVDRMEQLIQETGKTGFHFVDEAAPPKLLKQIALELIRRELSVTWWTNIRFEKNFSSQLCLLLAKSGCIAVSGGLETVSDRLLELMNKGITIPQAVRVLSSFQQAGIMVHAYLMFGFPTQTEQETIDSLEIVRQLFEQNLLQSGYWHRFTLTTHSLLAANPQHHQIKITGPSKGNFAWNDLEHLDPIGGDHGKFAGGLEKAIYNYMLGLGYDQQTTFWFEFDAPATTVADNYIQFLREKPTDSTQTDPDKRLIWIGSKPELLQAKSKTSRKKPGKRSLIFYDADQVYRVNVTDNLGQWVDNLLPSLAIGSPQGLTVQQVAEHYEQETGDSFTTLQSSEIWHLMLRIGLIVI